jgi:hypothetical protein
MKNKFFVLGMLAMVLALNLVLIGCDIGNGEENNDPTSPSAAYLQAKEWKCTSGSMGNGVTSQTFVFSGTNAWTNTLSGGSHDGQTVIGTYTISSLTITLTVTAGGTLTGSSAPTAGTQITATFDATQATKFTIQSQNLVFNRQP